MNNNTRKIVVLNNIKSPKIEQAIFILRDDADFCESDAVSEAEKIVSLYLDDLNKPLYSPPKIRNKNFSIIIGSVMCALFSLVTALCILNLIK